MFSCEISQIFKNIFFTEHLRCLLLEGVCEGNSLVRILQSCHFNIFGINHRCFERCPLRKIMNNRDCWNVYCFFSCLSLLESAAKISNPSEVIEQLHCNKWSVNTNCLIFVRGLTVRFKVPMCSAALL